jgi:hypothetical protein
MAKRIGAVVVVSETGRYFALALTPGQVAKANRTHGYPLWAVVDEFPSFYDADEAAFELTAAAGATSF